MTNLTPLYYGIAGMIILAITIISITVWATRMVIRFKKFAEKRDEHYMSRIDGLEAIMRNEFKAMVDILKN